ncbi:MAG: hypothetical protein JSV92_00315 [archaeon]|nr:MAG: hypothetical protein JSV92_00315 [archaeon]
MIIMTIPSQKFTVPDSENIFIVARRSYNVLFPDKDGIRKEYRGKNIRVVCEQPEGKFDFIYVDDEENKLNEKDTKIALEQYPKHIFC